jgi:hypothetical protein
MGSREDSISASQRKRDKLADSLTWLANRHVLNLAEDRRHLRRTPKRSEAEALRRATVKPPTNRKEAAKRAKPVLLEPVMAIEVVTPQEFLGDVIGDLSRRRGHVEGQEPRGNAVAVKGSVPLSAMFGYATDLRSSTQGRATYTMQFDRYDEVPSNIAEEIVEHRTGEPVGAGA